MVKIKGNAEYLGWLSEMFASLGIECCREISDSESEIETADGRVDLDTLYNMDFYPRLMQVFMKLSFTNNPNGLILGCSLARDAVDVNMLDGNYLMLGNSAQDFYYDSLCFYNYIKYFSDFRYFIHVYAPFSLRYDESKSTKKEDNVKFYYTMFNDLHNCTTVDDSVEKYQIEKDKFNTIFSGITTWANTRRKLWDCFFLDTQWRDETLDDRFFDRNNVSQDEIDMVLAEFNKPYPLTIIENKKIVRKMYQIIKEKGVVPLIVFPPLNDVYRKYWNCEHYHEVLEFANELKSSYGCVILNLTYDDVPDGYFKDIIHLNSYGKRYVTGMIKETLDKMKI